MTKKTQEFPGYGKAGVLGQHNEYDDDVIEALIDHGFAQPSRGKVQHWTTTLDDSLLRFKQEHGIREGGVGPRTWEALSKKPKRSSAKNDDKHEKQEQTSTEVPSSDVEPSRPGADPTLPEDPLIQVGEHEEDEKNVANEDEKK